MKKIKLFLVSVVLSTSLVKAQVPTYVPTSGLQAWWGFGSNVNDLSGNGNNLTNSGATFVADRNGNASSAASFDGVSSAMQITSPSFTFSPSGAFTYSFWMKKETQVSAAGIVMMSGVSTSGVFITLIQGASNFTFGTNKQQSSWFFLSCAHTLNVWDHYVTTFNAGIMKIYKNGVFQNTLTYTHTGATSATIPFYIGRGLNATGANYKGALDDIGIWDRELSTTEINALFTSITDVKETSTSKELIAYPNPAQNVVNFETSPAEIGNNYVVYNVNGTIVFKGTINSLVTQINTQLFPAGNYYIECGESKKVIYKFLKQNN